MDTEFFKANRLSIYKKANKKLGRGFAIFHSLEKSLPCINLQQI